MNFPEKIKIKRCLLIIDMQYDFISGSLKVSGGEELVMKIAEYLKENSDNFDLIVFTKDDHPREHVSFASNHKSKVPFDEYTYVSKNDSSHVFKSCLWPDHCVVGTPGNEIHNDLTSLILNEHIGKTKTIVVGKGKNLNREYYSCFNDVLEEDFTELQEILETELISEVFICGLAYDYCVINSAKSSVQLGFTTFVAENLTRKIDSSWECNEPGVKVVTQF
ncbi:hypothetical protein QEN19_001674 [Hanseniaspora menglaensis]